jgi:hypothetical protein
LALDSNPPADIEDLIAFIDTVTKGGERAMVDLADVARKHYFHPATNGSCSIKKVLPAVLQGSPRLQAIYGQPIYGADGGIPSKNFRKMAWLQRGPDGQVRDPYKLLAEKLEWMDENEENPGINQGGAASYAYLRLQFESLGAAEREALKKALLRYCELDTLAMGFVVQGWSASLFEKANSPN